MNEKNATIKDARTLGIPRMLLLGLQHMFAMFGATILVPILVNTYFNGEGLSIQVTLICAGLGTLFFHALLQTEGTCFPGFILRISSADFPPWQIWIPASLLI